MNKYIIVALLHSIAIIKGCRCTRDFEDENACARSYLVIEIKPANDEAFITLNTTDPSIRIVSSKNKKKSTLYIDLDEDQKYKYVKCTTQDGKSLDIHIYYSTRKKLVSINKGSIVEFKIDSVTCPSSYRCTNENEDYLNSLDKEADVQIFII